MVEQHCHQGINAAQTAFATPGPTWCVNSPDSGKHDVSKSITGIQIHKSRTLCSVSCLCTRHISTTACADAEQNDSSELLVMNLPEPYTLLPSPRGRLSKALHTLLYAICKFVMSCVAPDPPWWFQQAERFSKFREWYAQPIVLKWCLRIITNFSSTPQNRYSLNSRPR